MKKHVKLTPQEVLKFLEFLAKILDRKGLSSRDMEQILRASRTKINQLLSGTYPHGKLDRKKRP